MSKFRFSDIAGDLISGGLSSVASMATGLVSNAINMKNQRKMQSEQNAFNAQQAQISREWNEQMDNTKYQRQVADMQAAGVNPALAMNGGVTTQATSNATAQAANVQAPRVDLTSAVQMAMQAKQLNIQKDIAQSQINKNNAEADKIRKDTEWTDRLNQASVDSIEAKTNLSNADVRQIYKNMDKADAEIAKIKAETKNEEERFYLIQADTALKEANAYQIAAMVPYQQMLMSGQSDAQRAQAANATVQAAYQQGLIDNGMIEALVRHTNAGASEYEVKAIATDMENTMKDGTFEEKYYSIANWEGREADGATRTLRGIHQFANSFGRIVGEFTSGININIGASKSSSTSHSTSTSTVYSHKM